MGEYLEMPWNIEDTIQNLIELKEGIKEAAIAVNLHGKGKQDAEEIEYDFDRAIKALEEIQQYRAIGTPEEFQAAVEEHKKIRNKAIDDFVKKISESDQGHWRVTKYEHGEAVSETMSYDIGTIKLIAEQLKGSGVNE